MRRTLTLTADLQYRIAFVRLQADRGADAVAVAKQELADAVLAAVDAPVASRVARLAGIRCRPVPVVVEVALRPKRRA